jgi:hypothetical protein
MERWKGGKVNGENIPRRRGQGVDLYRMSFAVSITTGQPQTATEIQSRKEIRYSPKNFQSG